MTPLGCTPVPPLPLRLARKPTRDFCRAITEEVATWSAPLQTASIRPNWHPHAPLPQPRFVCAPLVAPTCLPAQISAKARS